MRRNRLVTTLAALAGLSAGAASFAGGAATASATSYYGPYLVLASPSLNERTAPSTSASIVGSLPYHATIYIACQTTGTVVNGSDIWDQLSDTHFVSDYYVSTPVFNAFTPGIPQCQTTPPPPPPPPPPPSSGAWGRTVSYNEGGTGECTWWAINEFHAFTGVYPNLVAPGNNGNAMYWAGNAAYNGWTVTATPRVDTIVVFPANTAGAGSVGHVAWVSGVSSGHITISEMNWYAWDRVDTRTIVPVSSFRYILAP